MNIDQARELETEAQHNDGKCSNCDQPIKIYRYRINRSASKFLKAMAAEVQATGKNDVDIETISIPYSVRSQVTKMRLHGLIARVKNEAGKQIARHWLITHKGWSFLKGGTIPVRVIEYNNQVLGHDGGTITISEALGEISKPEEPAYTETPISEPEARAYSQIRKPKRKMVMDAIYKGRTYSPTGLQNERRYTIEIDRLQVGKPVKLLSPAKRVYAFVSDFQKDWRIV